MIVAVASAVTISALMAVRSVREKRIVGQHDSPTPEVMETTWEGQWEVPVIEGDEQSKSFTLAKNKRFHMRVNEDVTDFKAGEVVTVLWEPGKVHINDIQVQPYPNERIVLTASQVMERYGQIPVVQEYLSEHRSEASEDEIATRAVESWYSKNEEVTRHAAEHYRKLLGHAAPREAAEGARDLIRASGLVDSIAVRLDTPPGSQAQALDVIWKGQRGQPGALVGILLTSENNEIPPETVTAKRLFKQLVDMLDLLTYGDNELSVRYEGGSVFLEGRVVPRPEGEKP